jgi:hypothetical protein
VSGRLERLGYSKECVGARVRRTALELLKVTDANLGFNRNVFLRYGGPKGLTALFDGERQRFAHLFEACHALDCHTGRGILTTIYRTRR